ncbi:hypothetical protein L5515_014584 [Caenorhabditis briggsae]|uniref:Uncharacterized protein n=1 Tax=Caenorhabditis briggsae TaxID=6238 RepID=A0AAE9J8W1_CAEBR|nr:hypothetical protein L3Y34_018465 [Caenorhabditis briggsae]UMM18590.1 hypothetical protein L5515_014584 [Caenorhabditis briggsae]
MKISISIILLSVLIHLSSPLGDLPESGDFESPEALTSSDAAPVLNSGVVGGEDGPTPPSVSRDLQAFVHQLHSFRRKIQERIQNMSMLVLSFVVAAQK